MKKQETGLPLPSGWLGFFKQFSIKGKLLSVTMTVSIFAMLLASATFTTYQWFSFRSWVTKNLTAQADILAYNVRSALAFQAPADALDMLQSFEPIDSINGAIIYDSEGDSFASWIRDDAPPFGGVISPQDRPVRQNGNILLARPVSLNDTSLGIVVLRSSQSELYSFIRDSIFAVISLVLLTTVVAFFLSVWLQKIISRPILDLADIMAAVSRTKDYSIRGTIQSNDESGQLTGYFNDMLAQVELRDHHIREREQLLNAIINNTSSFIYLKDLEQRYTMLNEPYLRALNKTEAEILGRRDYELFPSSLAEVFENNDLRVLEENRLLEFDEQTYYNNAAHDCISIRFPLKDNTDTTYATCCISTDITERKKTEQELQELRNYLSNVIDSMPSILIGVNISGEVTRWNRQAEKLSGIPSSLAMGKILEKLLPQFGDELQNIGRAIEENRVISSTKLRTIRDGKLTYNDMTVYPLIANGISGAVVRIDDISERMRLEEMMVQTEKMMSVGGLAAGMAHEINNPLGIMIQAAQNIARRISMELEPNHKAATELNTDMVTIRAYMEKRMVINFIEDIRNAGTRAATIVASMLKFSRRSESVQTLCDVCLLIDNTIELAAKDYNLKKQYDFRRLEIIRRYDDDIPQVQLIETEIEQVILNLLKNAAQAIAGDKESDQKGQIIIRVRREEQYIRIEVEDNGPGMEEDIRTRIFEPFFTTKKVGSGTGLGLSVSYMIVTNNHNGTMSVESQPGRGTTFIIRLPLD
ncbi:MAG: ATP-binding protein [Thermodesulfobacteriota bacterium]